MARREVWNVRTKKKQKSELVNLDAKIATRITAVMKKVAAAHAAIVSNLDEDVKANLTVFLRVPSSFLRVAIREVVKIIDYDRMDFEYFYRLNCKTASKTFEPCQAVDVVVVFRKGAHANNSIGAETASMDSAKKHNMHVTFSDAPVTLESKEKIYDEFTVKSFYDLCRRYMMTRQMVYVVEGGPCRFALGAVGAGVNATLFTHTEEQATLCLSALYPHSKLNVDEMRAKIRDMPSHFPLDGHPLFDYYQMAWRGATKVATEKVVKTKADDHQSSKSTKGTYFHFQSAKCIILI